MMTDLLDRLDDEQREKAEPGSLPDWMDPMLATLTHDPFSDENWVYERKLDGERVLAFVDPDGGARLLSRNQKEIHDSYPEIQRALEDRAIGGCVLDGEIVAFDEDGVSDFQRLQPRMHASSREESEKSGIEVFYYLFDCMYADGHDLSECSLLARKKILREVIDWGDPLRLTPHRREKGVEYWREACEKGWEGVIAKDARAAYAHSRSRKWLKFKCSERQELVIGGFTEPEGERVGIGALLLGFYDDGDLVYAGKVGTGFDDETLRDLRSRLDGRERKSSPYDRGEIPEGNDVHFVTPELVCEVAFTAWTDDDRLRHPRYEGLRRDKDAKQVTKESAG